MKRVVVLPWTCFFCAIVPDTSCWYPRWWPNCCRIVETQHSRCWWCHSHPLLDPRHWSSRASQVWKTQRKTVKWQFEAANQQCSFTMPFVCSIAQQKHAHIFSFFVETWETCSIQPGLGKAREAVFNVTSFRQVCTAAGGATRAWEVEHLRIDALQLSWNSSLEVLDLEFLATKQSYKLASVFKEMACAIRAKFRKPTSDFCFVDKWIAHGLFPVPLKAMVSNDWNHYCLLVS